MRIENRCPHRIAVVDQWGHERIIPRSYPATRIETILGAPLGCVEGVALHASPGFAGISHLPPRREGVIVVVSQIVALTVSALLPERDDVFYPGSSPAEGAIRAAGRGVTSVKRLIRAI